MSCQIELPHQDPAGRFIAATAVYHQLNAKGKRLFLSKPLFIRKIYDHHRRLLEVVRHQDFTYMIVTLIVLVGLMYSLIGGYF